MLLDPKFLPGHWQPKSFILSQLTHWRGLALNIYSQNTGLNTKNSATLWPKLNLEYILLKPSAYCTTSQPYLGGPIIQSKVNFSAFPPLIMARDYENNKGS